MDVAELEIKYSKIIPQTLRDELESLWKVGCQESGRRVSPLDWVAVVDLKSDPIIALDKVTVKRSWKVGRFSRIDPNCYISPNLEVGEHSHIAHNVTLGGGNDEVRITLGNHVGLAAGSRIYAISDDPRTDPFSAYPFPLDSFFSEGIKGDVVFENYSGVGLNAVVLPGTTFKEGAFILPLSQVAPNSTLDPWALYAGVGKQFRQIGVRNKEAVTQKTNRIERFAHLALEVQALLGIARQSEVK